MAKKIIIFSGFLITATITYVVVNYYLSKDKVEITLKVSPTKSTILLDGHLIKDSTFRVSKGRHVFKTSFKDFESIVKTVDISTPQVVLLAPAAKTGAAKQYFIDNPDEQLAREGIGGQEFGNASTRLRKYDDLLAELPHYDRTFSVSYGNAINTRDKTPGNIALYVRATTPNDRQLANDWITQQGTSLSEIEIVYENFNNLFIGVRSNDE